MAKAIFIIRSESVAGLGVEPSLGDYEPPVQPYTTPHVNELSYYTTKFGKIRIAPG